MGPEQIFQIGSLQAYAPPVVACDMNAVIVAVQLLGHMEQLASR